MSASAGKGSGSAKLQLVPRIILGLAGLALGALGGFILIEKGTFLGLAPILIGLVLLAIVLLSDDAALKGFGADLREVFLKLAQSGPGDTGQDPPPPPPESTSGHVMEGQETKRVSAPANAVSDDAVECLIRGLGNEDADAQGSAIAQIRKLSGSLRADQRQMLNTAVAKAKRRGKTRSQKRARGKELNSLASELGDANPV